jgi:hypothetical protein
MKSWFTKPTETPLPAPAPAAPAYDKVFMEATAEFVTKYVGKKLAERDARIAKLEALTKPLKGELNELRATLADLLVKFNAVESTIQTLMADFKAESGVRDGLVRTFELQIAEMRGRVSAVLRDYT